jgi:hypothetical protein
MKRAAPIRAALFVSGIAAMNLPTPNSADLLDLVGGCFGPGFFAVHDGLTQLLSFQILTFPHRMN